MTNFLNRLLTLPIARWLTVLFLTCATTQLNATHIVGAELYYECLSPAQNQYRVTLRMLRDCLLGQADFDNPIYLFAFPVLNPGAQSNFIIDLPPVTPNIVPPEWNQCTGTTYPLCIEEAIYQRVITLPPILGGYNLGWARCCRNSNIDNLFNPLGQGVSFLAHIPGPENAVCNSMPSFNNQLPVFICGGEDFYFDHSATDPDGDSLVYRLTRPYDGLNILGAGAGNGSPGANPPTVTPANPMGPPPYQLVNYAGPTYSAQDPFGLNSADIDEQSGLLHFRAPNLGVFVVAVSVFEYRNGVLLSENKKDLQIHVVQCLPQNDPPVISHNFHPGDSVSGDTVIIVATDTTCYSVTVLDTNGNAISAIPVSSIFSGPDAPTLSYSGTNPLIVDICWEADCDFAGSTIELIMMGWDESNCPIYNAVFDTVFIKIIPPPDVAPALDHDLSAVSPFADTVVIPVDSQACFLMYIADTANIGGPISYTHQVEVLNGGGAWAPSLITPNLSFPDSIPFNVCFEPGCEQLGGLYRIILEGVLDDACPPFNRAQDTVYIRVLDPPNPPPVIGHDLAGNPSNGDTIVVDVHVAPCYTVTIRDTFPGQGFDYDFAITALDGFPTGGTAPQITVLQQNADSMELEVCWFTSCDNVGRVFMLVTTGIQENACDREASSRDTVYVRVNPVNNPPPQIAHNFLPGYQVNGDTILIAADSAACYGFALWDTVRSSYLSLSAHTVLAGSSDSTLHAIDVTITDSTDTLLAGTVCFVPGCEWLDETLLVILTGKDTFDCDTAKWVYDTVLVKVVAPANNPPVISHDLSGLPVVGGVVEVPPQAEPYCYTVTLEDRDSLPAELTAQGVGHIYEDWWRYGNPASISVVEGNPYQVTVCWTPSCYDSGEEFQIVVCGRDQSRCNLLEDVCDTVTFRITDCDVNIGNVFTPNGDGITDIFLPFNAVGLDYYRLHIFDRWGKELFLGEGEGWDGKTSGGQNVPEGVYYYVLETQLLSARGVPLKDISNGWVTLMR